ncbi:MAG: hypothetical protein JWP78_275 [Mucilaginibacter sp.]|nr:hypothetical protein [Mucilaginibacter sp.]
MGVKIIRFGVISQIFYSLVVNYYTTYFLIMKKINPDQVVSVVLKYLLHFLINAGIYFALLFIFTSFWLHQLFSKFSHMAYLSDDDFHRLIYFELAIYTLFCYFANNFVFDLYHRKRAKQLMFSVIVDLLIIPVDMFIMIAYNNIALKHTIMMEASLYNVYLITVLIVIKELITGIILSRKKTEGGKPNYTAR